MSNPDQLKRQLGWVSASIIVVANMIGSGIFGNTGFIQEQVGSPLMVMVLWLIGGLIAISGALCYAELSTLYPHAGGEYVYLKQIFGGLPSFLTGWISLLVGFAAPAAAAALLSGVYVSDYFKVVAPDGVAASFFADTGNRKIFATFLVVLFSLFHSFGVKQGSRIQNFLTVSKVVVILLFTVGGLIFAHASLDTPVTQAFSSQLAPNSLGGMGVGLMFVMFAYSGWNAAAYLAEEIKDPERNLPRSLVAGTVFTIIIYLAMNYVYYLAVPASELAGNPAPASLAATKIFGDNINRIFHIAFSFMLLSTLSACVMIGPRVYYAMARDRLFFSFANHVTASGVPLRSIMVQGAISLLYIWLGTYEDIQTYMGFSLALFPVLTAFGLILHRRRHPDIGRGYKSPLFPLLPIIFITISALMIYTSYVGRPHEGNFALSVMLGGIPMFFLWEMFNEKTATRQIYWLIFLQVFCIAAAAITFRVMKFHRDMINYSTAALLFEIAFIVLHFLSQRFLKGLSQDRQGT